MSKTSEIKLIDKAFAELEYALDNREARGWSAYIDQTRQEEKDHSLPGGGVYLLNDRLRREG